MDKFIRVVRRNFVNHRQPSLHRRPVFGIDLTDYRTGKDNGSRSLNLHKAVSPFRTQGREPIGCNRH